MPTYLNHQKTAITALQQQIRAHGETPETCPLCQEHTLFPIKGKRKEWNSHSRYRDEFICNLCGEAEVLGDFWTPDRQLKEAVQ